MLFRNRKKRGETLTSNVGWCRLVRRNRSPAQTSGPGRLKRASGKPIAGMRGSITIEFVFVFMGSMALFAPVAEFYRLSLFDQTLARVTHQAARAAAADPANCEETIVEALHRDRVARWLFDQDDDGRIDVGSALSGRGIPALKAKERELEIAVVADNDLQDAVEWDTSMGCGGPGSLIELRSRVFVHPWFGMARWLWPMGILRQKASWARNQG